MNQQTSAVRLLRPLARFLQLESSSGIVLLACTFAALVLANSAWAVAFAGLWNIEIGFDFALKKSLLHWINDGLMTLFFFVVGLEIKREFVSGELSEWKKAMLPLVAAAGGMVAPAAIYLGIHGGQPTARGWGVPTATDIAFVVGFLVLLGNRVPNGLKVMLLSLAIVDDIGAILVIALGYNKGVELSPLAAGLGGFVVVLVLNWAGVRRVFIYLLVGIGIWFCFLKSGVHPTVVGVILGLLTPARPLSVEPTSPAERLEQALHPWVAFLIMPIFALANAGVALDPVALGSSVSLAVAMALLFGKPLGIVLFSLVSVRLRLAKLPDGVDGKVLLGGGCLAGIGFTMSLFIASLAFDGAHLDEAKVGILAGSALSAIVGVCLLLWFLPKSAAKGPTDHLPSA